MSWSPGDIAKIWQSFIGQLCADFEPMPTVTANDTLGPAAVAGRGFCPDRTVQLAAATGARGGDDKHPIGVGPGVTHCGDPCSQNYAYCLSFRMDGLSVARANRGGKLSDGGVP